MQNLAGVLRSYLLSFYSPNLKLIKNFYNSI